MSNCRSKPYLYKKQIKNKMSLGYAIFRLFIFRCHTVKKATFCGRYKNIWALENKKFHMKTFHLDYLQ